MTEIESTNLADILDQTIASIFENMMGLEARPVESAGLGESNRVTARVHVTGSWNGMIMLEVSPDDACRIAGRFLSMDAPEAVDNDVRDVLGEVANMIGGNLKSALVPDGSLSIPEVVDGTDFSLRMCGGAITARQAFACEAGDFCVSLIQPRNP